MDREVKTNGALGKDFPSIVGMSLGLFFVMLSASVLSHPQMFSKRHGRRHGLSGLVHLIVLLVGVYDCVTNFLDEESGTLFAYHLILGLSGLNLTLTAAFDFRDAHSRVRNIASGALEKNTTISYSEMIEHSFYQGINILQIVFLHMVYFLDSVQQAEIFSFYDARPRFKKLILAVKVCALVIVTSPWLFRNRFPVNRFSDNYTKGQNVLSIYSILYRLKKYQYIAYKHFFLHGLNVTLLGDASLDVSNPYFRIYWLMMNTAYVMEFFMQSLVKKNFMSQERMLFLNQYLMLVGSIGGIFVITKVNVMVSLASLFLNFANRGHDFENVMLITTAYILHLLL